MYELQKLLNKVVSKGESSIPHSQPFPPTLITPTPPPNPDHTLLIPPLLPAPSLPHSQKPQNQGFQPGRVPLYGQPLGCIFLSSGQSCPVLSCPSPLPLSLAPGWPPL